MEERIVLAVDTTFELATPWGKQDGPSRFEVVINSLKNWVSHKKNRVEWALVSLGNEAELGVTWTFESDMILATLDSLSPRSEPEDTFDLDSLVSVCEQIGVDQDDRIVLVFARSDKIPSLTLHIPCFFDVLYVHRKQSQGENKCQEIYTFLTNIQARKHQAASYFFETATSLPRLSQHCALLLAHPHIRHPQDVMLAKLDWKHNDAVTGSSIEV